MCTGVLSALKPGAEVKRFKASDVRVKEVEGIVHAVQDIKGLKAAARVLQSSGLVQCVEPKSCEIQKRCYVMGDL